VSVHEIMAVSTLWSPIWLATYAYRLNIVYRSKGLHRLNGLCRFMDLNVLQSV